MTNYYIIYNDALISEYASIYHNLEIIPILKGIQSKSLRTSLSKQILLSFSLWRPLHFNKTILLFSELEGQSWYSSRKWKKVEK